MLILNEPDIVILVKGKEFVTMTKGRVEMQDRPDLDVIVPRILELCMHISHHAKLRLQQRGKLNGKERK